MSRSGVPKSRSDKSRTLSQMPPTLQTTVMEIVPGRFSESDWHTMLTAEDGENYVGDIIEDILGQVLDDCYKIYIEKQLLPFTIAQAKDAILQIIEWRFLAYDTGENNVAQEPSWQEDEAPVTYITDSWAQGSVPVVRPPSTPTLEKQETSEEAPGDILCRVKEDGGQTSSQNVTTTTGRGAGPECESGGPGHQGVQDMSPLCKEPMCYYQDLDKEPGEPQTLATVKKKRQKFKPHRGPLGSAKLHNITKSLDKMEMELLLQQAPQPCPEEQPVSPCEIYWMPSYFQNVLKIQNSRPPLNNSMTFDEFGNVTSVRKLKPSRFPRHQVRPRFQLLDADLETEGHRLVAARAVRPLVFRSGNFGKMSIPARYDMRRTRQKGPRSWGSPGTQAGRKLVIGGSKVVKAVAAPAARWRRLSDPCAASTTPEFMEFVPDGAKDRNHSTCGQCPEYEEVEQGRLRPICNNVFIPPIPLAKLLQSHTSHVRLSSELTSSAVQ